MIFITALNRLKSWGPLIALVLGLLVFFVAGGQRYLSFASFKQYYQKLLTYREQHYLFSILLFAVVYITNKVIVPIIIKHCRKKLG